MQRNLNNTFSVLSPIHAEPVGQFYSGAVAAWFERMITDLIDMRARRLGQSRPEIIAYYRARN